MGNNLVSGNDLMNGVGRATWQGAISVGIGGGIAGYRNAKAIGANVWTGTKYDYIGKHYQDPNYNYQTSAQTDESKDCVFWTAEHADHGYGNRTMLDFKTMYQNAYPNEDLSKEAPSPLKLWALEKGKSIKYPGHIDYPTVKNMKFIGEKLEQPNYRIIATIGRGNTGHQINLTGVQLAKHYNIFFGGTKNVYLIDYWNPIGQKFIFNSRANVLQIIHLPYY